MHTTLGQQPPLGRVERGEQDLGEAQNGFLFNLECFSFEKKMKQIGQNVNICETSVLAIYYAVLFHSFEILYNRKISWHM